MKDRDLFEKRALGRQWGAPPVVLEAPSSEVMSLPALEVLEQRIRGRLLEIRHQKRLVLKELCFIYANRDYYFQDWPAYQQNFALYIEERIQQDHTTSLDDAKIVRLLNDHGAESVLDLEVGDMIYLLKRIAQVSDVQGQKFLLERLPALTRQGLKQELMPWQAPGSQTPARTRWQRGPNRWRYRVEKRKKQIVLQVKESVDVELWELLMIWLQVDSTRWRNLMKLIQSVPPEEQPRS